MIQPLYDFYVGHPEKWHQGSSMVDKDGHLTSSYYRGEGMGAPVKFCLFGALEHLGATKIISPSSKYSYQHRLDAAAKESFIRFNDDPNTKFEDVLTLIEKA